MDELFTLWLQVREQAKAATTDEERESLDEQKYLIEDELHHDYGKVLRWNREEQRWQLVDAK